MLKLMNLIGKKLVVAGLEEAVERCASDGSFEWLHIMPLLERIGGDPDVPRCRDPKKYAEAVDSIVAKAAAQIHAEQAQPEPEPEPEAIAAAANEPKPAAAANDPSAGVGLEWLKQVLLYAPNIEALNAVLHHAFIEDYIAQLGPAVAHKVGVYSFPTAHEVTGLASVMENTPGLQEAGMTIASLLLANKEIDVFNEETLNVVEAIARHVALGETDTAAQQQLQKTRELSLLDAAKGWLKRNHGEKATTIGIAWIKSEKELQEERTAAMVCVMADVDGLLRTSVLQPHARSLVFEMTRCHMFKGTPSNVLNGLCTAAGKRGGFGLVSSQFETLAAEKAAGLVKELVSQVLDKPHMLNECLNMIVKTLPSGSVLSDKLIESFACTMSLPTKDKPAQAPSLASILIRSQQWAKIIRSALTTSTQHDSGVKALISKVQGTINETAKAILDETIVLRELHAVLDSSTDYIMLTDLLGLGSTVSHGLLSDKRSALHTFSTQLQHISVYANSFCSCGLPIDAEELVKRVGGVTSSYDTLPFSATHGVFDGIEVSFRWKNPDFLLRNPDLLFRNPDFLLKIVDCIIKPDRGRCAMALQASVLGAVLGHVARGWRERVREHPR